MPSRPASVPVSTHPQEAATVLLAGGLVGLPTETVYGLAAMATDRQAVARVYAVKGRPADHPLIVHLGTAASLDAWAEAPPGYARALAEALWPGPLTLVLRRSARAGDHVTGGQDTVALRVPAHPAALAVLRDLDALDPAGAPHGIAAPSANRFGRVSPTTVEHVLAELGPVLDPARDLVLDGGPARVGVESTILDCTGPAPALLRPGAIDAAAVRRITGLALGQHASPVRAPGTLRSHYAPLARVRIVAATDLDVARPAAGAAVTVGLLALAEVATPEGVVRLCAPEDADAYARGLFAALREADALGLATVLAVPPPEAGIGAAVRDRLRRAAAAPS